jgi:uncharacterized protein YkwD
VPTRAVWNPYGVCLLHPIRTERAAHAATPFASLGKLLSSHRAIIRVSLAALSFTVLAAFSQPAAQAGPRATPVTPESLLPQSVGNALDTSAAITISFESAMDPGSVESAFQLLPAQPVQFVWNEAHTALTVAPERQWRTDERYLVVVGADAATSRGVSLRSAQRFSFTTVTAPAVTDFQVFLAGRDLAAATAAAAAKEVTVRSAVMATDSTARMSDRSSQATDAGARSQPPARTARKVSAATSISIDFSVPMNRADVERRFAIAPDVEGSLSWRQGSLVFTPSDRLAPGTRYTISVIGAHDRNGNALGGDANFSFIVQSSAQVTKTGPAQNATDAEPANLTMWFSQPMDRKATARALRVLDAATGAPVAGTVAWSKASTQLTFTPDQPFAAGHLFEVALGKGGRDADGNVVKAKWSFSTRGAVAPVSTLGASASTRSAPAIPPPAPATSLAGYALNQVNAARSAYGFRPLVLDASISAVAASHAMDQAVNGYFSHTGLNGSTRESRLRAGGVSFGWSGENQCYLVGRGQQATLNWCHAQFMAEPYPGHWNHIANILNPQARRMGVGIAQVGGKIVIVWDFTD